MRPSGTKVARTCGEKRLRVQVSPRQCTGKWHSRGIVLYTPPEKRPKCLSSRRHERQNGPRSASVCTLQQCTTLGQPETGTVVSRTDPHGRLNLRESRETREGPPSIVLCFLEGVSFCRRIRVRDDPVAYVPFGSHVDRYLCNILPKNLIQKGLINAL